MGPYSDFLVARPSIIEGIARIFDFGNTLNAYNNSPSEMVADEIALRMDWEAVGYYLENAMREYDKEIKQAEPK
ncbi:MAG: hypothetical protein Q8Q07_00120 [Dehalococcoidales bacterium]|nr:hypothetical protein [Dehalococcoidales bacterium]